MSGPDRAHEDRCRRCGRCCHEKFMLDDGRVVLTEIPCPFLDPATRLCRVYEERFANNPRCASAADALAMGAHPGDCPYAADLGEGYRAPLDIRNHPELRALLKFDGPADGKEE